MKIAKKWENMKTVKKIKSAIKPYFMEVWMRLIRSDKSMVLVFGGLIGFVFTLVI